MLPKVLIRMKLLFSTRRNPNRKRKTSRLEKEKKKKRDYVILKLWLDCDAQLFGSIPLTDKASIRNIYLYIYSKQYKVCFRQAEAMKLLVLLLFLAQVIQVHCWSPTNSYKPGKVDCPDGDLVRAASSLSEEESKWLKGRQNVLKGNLIDFLLKSNMSDFDAEDFVNNAKKIPTIGVAFSGGGYRAMLCGAGQLSALDNRTNGGNEKGLGGLLQASTYLAGLSGGSWLVGTIAMNNFTSV